MDRFQIQNRLLQINQSLISGYGTPCTYYHNSSLLSNGQIVSTTNTTSLVKCYCWTNQAAQPDRTHALCSGTGYIDINGTGGGYQKYGYREHIFSTPSNLSLSSTINLIKSADNKSYTISGTSITETITSTRITLDNCLAFDYFIVKDQFDPVSSKIEYYYSFNDTTWTQITMATWTGNAAIGSRYGTISIPALTPYIRFRVTLRKKTATSPSGIWNSIRFRYRKMKTLREIDPRFEIDIPSFLAVRQQQKTIIEGSEQGGGWIQRYPLQWRVLPDATIENTDVIKFLTGTYADYIFEAHDVTKMSYGETQQILHRDFESQYLRDENDIMKVVHLLI